MIWSRYNFLFKSEKCKCYFLFNSMSNILCRLDELTAEHLRKVKNEGKDYSNIETEEKKFLVENKILVEDDNLEFAKFKMIKYNNRMNLSKMSLTIAPTLECNLQCKYCFEKNHPAIRMDDDIENAIVSYIDSQKLITSLHVSWFGGEPLLYFDRIVSLTKKIRKIKHLKKYTADIITNGVSFDKAKVDVLRELSINVVHVTIDGLEVIHNLRRPEESSGNSFMKIMQNLDSLSKYDDIAKTIRVNIDKSNKKEFINVYNLIKNRYKGLNFNTYIGFIKDSYGCDNKCVNSMSTIEQAEFIIKSYNQLKTQSPTLFPTRYNYECIARCRNSFLIDPNGDLYKCWTDIGNKDMCIGNIKLIDEFSVDMYAKYMVGADPFDDEKCQECPIFPICGGGCPHSRIMNKFYNTNNNNCHYIKGRVEKFIETFYMNSKP